LHAKVIDEAALGKCCQCICENIVRFRHDVAA
jgi:hypothetical protein